MIIESISQSKPEEKKAVTHVEKLQERLGSTIVTGIVPLVYPDEVLAQKAQPCIYFDEKLDILFATLLATLRVTGGVGISAIQVGIPYQACVIAAPGQEIILAANARILETDGEMKCLSEGCLSMPAGKNRFNKDRTPFTVPVFRPEEITVQYQDIEGHVRKVVVTGFEARIWQHEIDHANGKLIIDCVNSFRRKEALAKYNKSRARSA